MKKTWVAMTIKEMDELPELLQKLKFGKIDKEEFDRLSALIAIIVNCPTKVTKQAMARRFMASGIQNQPTWIKVGIKLELNTDNCRVITANYLKGIDLKKEIEKVKAQKPLHWEN